MTEIISFDYQNKKVVITKTVGNVVYVEIISWKEMELRAIAQIKEMR